jgi:hypothetical protein
MLASGSGRNNPKARGQTCLTVVDYLQVMARAAVEFQGPIESKNGAGAARFADQSRFRSSTLPLRQNVMVNAGATARIDTAMQPGRLTDQIEVSATVATIQTEKAKVTTVVENNLC